MQNVKTTETAGLVVFTSILETKPGGGTLAVADLTQDEVLAGTPVGLDSSTNLLHVVKCATMQDDATNSATDYKVEKGHNFIVGDIITSGLLKKAYAITAITTTETAYDTITIGTTLGVAVSAGDILIQATAVATGNTSAYKYTPIGLLGEDTDVVSGDNHLVSVVHRGSVINDNCPDTHSDIKTTLAGLIRWVAIP